MHTFDTSHPDLHLVTMLVARRSAAQLSLPLRGAACSLRPKSRSLKAGTWMEKELGYDT